MTGELEIFEGSDGLELRASGDVRGAALDLSELVRRIRSGRRGPLARACNAGSGRTVLDAMAGLGMDGLTLAGWGCTVTLVEAAPLIHRVLADGVDRARAVLTDPTLELRCADVRTVFDEQKLYDVVYLDPMFPERRKGALPQKRAQILALAAARNEAEMDIEDLIARARRICRDRVVLKRRARDPQVLEPAWTIRANRVRFDVYRGAASMT